MSETNIYVNNGYNLNVLATFGSSIKEVRFFPGNILLASSNTPVSLTLPDNTETKCYFKWQDINDEMHKSDSMFVTTKVFNIQDLIDNSNNVTSSFDATIQITNDEYNSCEVDSYNRFCQVCRIYLPSQAEVIFSTNNNENINNVITTLYNSDFTVIYNSNTLLSKGTYYLVISNGDNTISGGYTDLHVEITPVLDEPFASATLVTINTNSTHNFAGNITLDKVDTGIAYKFTVDGSKCHNIKLSDLTFTGTTTDYGVVLFADDGNGKIVQLIDGIFDTYIAPGTYYLAFYASDLDQNKCVGNFSFNINLGSDIEISGFDTLYSNGTEDLYVYVGQLFDNTLTKADPNSTAKLYPNNIDYVDQDRMGDIGVYKYFAIITSADGLTKVSTNINTITTVEVKYESNPTITIEPQTLSNNTLLYVNSNLSTYNDEGYMISGTQDTIVTIKNLTKNVVLGTVDVNVDNSFTITGSSAGDVIGFSAVFVLFKGDTRGMSYSTTITLV